MNNPVITSVRNNPFPGLRPFREDEEYLFFGRESQVDTMVNKLAATRFLVVVGPSGSGKSSLVNCGLRPALRAGLMPSAGTAWRMAQFRPGANPIGNMARALAQDGLLFDRIAPAGLPLNEMIEVSLRMSKLGLIDVCEQARLDKGVNLLVVVDQFEELFRYRQLGDGQGMSFTDKNQEATAFVNLLLEAQEQSKYPIYIVLTMRSDFLGDCAHFAGLPEVINNGQYLTPRMNRDERRSAISGPVIVGAAEIAPVLLTRLVNDVGDNPDQLSILQHALNRTWARWQNEGEGKGPLDLSHYKAIGTMSSALDQHAEKAYAELDDIGQKQICERLFKALTDMANDSRGVRRPTTMRTLCALTDATQAELMQVIDVFRKPSRSFLMPPPGASIEPDTVIDISHESLMRVWERLRKWASEEAQSARMYRRLADTSTLYDKDEPEAGLWRDPDLRVALRWRNQNNPNETWAKQYDPSFDRAMAFLRTSEKSESTRKTVRMVAMGAGVACLVLVPAYLSYSAKNVAEAEKVTAIADRRAADAQKNEAVAAKVAAESEAKNEKLAAETEKKEAELARKKADEYETAAKQAEESLELAEIGLKRTEGLIAKLDDVGAKLGKGEGENYQEAQTQIKIVKNELLKEVQAVVKPLDKEFPVKGGTTREVPTIVAGQTIQKLPFSLNDHKASSPTTIAFPGEDNFLTCASVNDLEPEQCKDSFAPGKVYVFARVVTPNEEEAITLRWLDASDKPVSSRQLKVKKSTEKGYRTYSWKTFGAGSYKVCLYDGKDRPLSSCRPFKVQ